eukprot:937811-Amphidinium_carterae.1
MNNHYGQKDYITNSLVSLGPSWLSMLLALMTLSVVTVLAVIRVSPKVNQTSVSRMIIQSVI